MVEFFYLTISGQLKKFKTGALIVISLQYTQAQNLVPDAGFENNKFIPANFSAINASRSWTRPSLGTSDLFCKCGKKQEKYSLVNVPHNSMGNQYPHTGSCYAGLFALSHGAYREYLQTPLKTSLEKNKTYEFSLYISLADYSRAAIDQLGVCFLNDKANYNNTNLITHLKPLYLKIENEARNDTVTWHCLKASYRATGGESFLLIGSFGITEIQPTKVKAPKEARSRINQFTERDAYYFIDDVSLIEVSDTSFTGGMDNNLKTTSDTSAAWPADVPLLLKNILFKSNEALLLSTSFSELDKVAEHLNKHPQLSIEIAGHTDSSGNENRNQKLSEKRARAVANYFTAKSIEPNRVTYKGYGSSMPVASNATEEGRRQNRRVEFMLRNK